MEEADHATPSIENTFANVVGVEQAPLGSDSRAVQELGSTEAQQDLPSGTDLPDRGAPTVHSDAEAALPESSYAEYHAAPPTHDHMVAEIVSDESRAASEEQGSVTAEGDVQSLMPFLSPVEGGLSTSISFYVMP